MCPEVCAVPFCYTPMNTNFNDCLSVTIYIGSDIKDVNIALRIYNVEDTMVTYKFKNMVYSP